ncbi:hypothetical protein ID866_4705 [Astraeus odoratus]|nr:hypothetical protein ID866_4705 [Astraeus odoratus]
MRSDAAGDHGIALGNLFPITTPGTEVVHFIPRELSSHKPFCSFTDSHVSRRVARQEKDGTLSSYRYPPAGPNVPTAQTVPGSRQNSVTSISTHSSKYSVESPTESHPASASAFAMSPCAVSPPAVDARRRPSIPSQGGSDRRRLVIVQTTSTEHDTKKQEASYAWTSDSRAPQSPDAVDPRKGLALVAPPDASPQSYRGLTPSSANSQARGQPMSSSSSTQHGRSSSEAVKVSSKGIMGHVPRKSSREVAIIGTAANFPEGVASDLQQYSKISPHLQALKLPLFQMPQSRSPSPRTSEISDSSSSAHRTRQRKDALAPGVSPIKEFKEGITPVGTPDIGESKHISDRVAGPVVINLYPESPSPNPRPPSQQSTSQQSMTSSINFSDPFTPSTANTSPVTDTSPYLHYQPGLHATAGPLPPPPKAVFSIDPRTPAPPRPPRQYPVRRKGDTEAMRQALQLPAHVTAALKAKSSVPASGGNSVVNAQRSSAPAAKVAPSSQAANESSVPGSPMSFPQSIHVREGAFPPSRLCTFDSEDALPSPRDAALSSPHPGSMDDLVASVGLAIDDMGIMNSSDVPPPTVIEPPRNHEGYTSRQGLEIRREEFRKDGTQFSVTAGPSLAIQLPSPPPSDENTTESFSPKEVLPPLPAKNDVPYLDAKIKNVLNLKRFSTLPRTPSLMSLNRHSIVTKHSSRTPSPSVNHSIPPARPPMRRIKSASPPAMNFADVLSKKTALERSLGYARKINELYCYDCGLSDWMAEVQHRASRPQSTGRRATLSGDGPRVPSTHSPRMEQRHVSQESTDSGITFPRRADAYSATDLSSRAAGDSSPPNAPPPLPYPALAAAPRNGPSRASTMIATSSSSSGRSMASPPSSMKPVGGFFSGLGRKTSLKKEQAPSTPLSPTRGVLVKNPPKVEPNPRPANVPPVAPSVPGGPRAPPNRMQRSQTIIISPQRSSNGASPQRSSTTARRPSLFGGRGSTPDKQSNTMSEADFNRQLDRLAALLPRADRNVLGVYLRHTGQDMLALGQYIEDDKNGTYRYDSS